MTKRWLVDDAGTLINIETRNTYDYMEDIVDTLNQLSNENRQLKITYAKCRYCKETHHCIDPDTLYYTSQQKRKKTTTFDINTEKLKKALKNINISSMSLNELEQYIRENIEVTLLITPIMEEYQIGLKKIEKEK